jgi:hypothetical protein
MGYSRLLLSIGVTRWGNQGYVREWIALLSLLKEPNSVRSVLSCKGRSLLKELSVSLLLITFLRCKIILVANGFSGDVI